MNRKTVLTLILSLFLFGCESQNNSVEKIIRETNSSIDDNVSKDENLTIDIPSAPEHNISVLVEINFKSTEALNNRAAYVTSQCYTKTVDDEGQIHNPCFSCHINSKEPNYIDDADLQERYDFSEYTKINRFTNLFKDRTKELSALDDTEMMEYIRKSNYKDENQTLLLKEKLKHLPAAWDVDGDGQWSGYTPDCYFDFDSEGFDKNPQGEYTLWRAFAYYPFLGTFWPTNGSTDDVMIRLTSLFTQDKDGVFNLEVYKLNLSIVESLIKEKNISIAEVDESLYGVDLNQNGVLDISSEVVFNWQTPEYNATTRKLQNFSMSYVGKAKSALEDNSYLIAPGLYPKHTEFLHSVRYLDVDANDNIGMSKRMKELRYAKKVSWNNYSQLSNAVMAEIKERDDFPERLRNIKGNTEEGLQTGLGWVYQGFIEDEHGALRPQNYEETLYCIGCHSGIGGIVDSTFVFPRKFENTSALGGWYHWTQVENAFKNIPEPVTRDGRNEYSLYLQENNAGDEFRANGEIMDNFFDDKGELIPEKITTLNKDISSLIIPSAERAKTLNKAYRIIVLEQSFIYGRDAHVKPVADVHKELELDTDTNVTRIEY